MKKDIPGLMAARNLQALIIFGNAENNPPMTYLTGGGHVSAATLIIKNDGQTVLFCNPMERDEAQKSGLKVRLYDEFPVQELLKQAAGDVALMTALRLKLMLQELQVSGRVGVYGTTDLSSLFAVLTHLKTLLPDLELLGETRESSLFMVAMETKEESEAERIRQAGKKTVEVVELVRQYLVGCHVNEQEILLKEDGSPLKLGDVKQKINLWLAERGVVPSEGYIFSLGRDAAVPHSQGNPDDLMCLGKTIVFDIYPQEAGGGYFYDFTRTWSLGYATPEAQTLFDQVADTYEKVVASLKSGMTFKEAQKLTCELFEQAGHETPLNHKASISGYIHSVGHGLGLNIHERPWSGLTAADDNVLKPGVVFTIEPGLYYPDQGMGFRIEDTYRITPDGDVELMAEYPRDFVLKMNHCSPR